MSPPVCLAKRAFPEEDLLRNTHIDFSILVLSFSFARIRLTLIWCLLNGCLVVGGLGHLGEKREKKIYFGKKLHLAKVTSDLRNRLISIKVDIN